VRICGRRCWRSGRRGRRCAGAAKTHVADAAGAATRRPGQLSPAWAGTAVGGGPHRDWLVVPSDPISRGLTDRQSTSPGTVEREAPTTRRSSSECRPNNQQPSADRAPRQPPERSLYVTARLVRHSPWPVTRPPVPAATLTAPRRGTIERTFKCKRSVSGPA
jgi:hypothetical protein